MIEDIIQIVIVIIAVVIFGFALYFRTKGNALGAVSELIAIAETSGLTGPEKMQQVVSALYEKIPAAFKSILTRERLQAIAQFIFGWMRQYAVAYIEVLHNQDEEGQDQVVKDALADAISGLVSLSEEILIEKAASYGIDLTGDESKEQIIMFIVEKLLAKA